MPPISPCSPRGATFRTVCAPHQRCSMELAASVRRSVTDVSAGAIEYSSAAGRGVVLAAVLGSGMAMLDGTVVNVALKTIGKDLDASLAELQWITNAYLLLLASLILLGGALGDRVGRRRVFLIGVVWFAVASVLCGIAPDTTTLIASRVLQGIGGALLTPGSLAIIEAVLRPTDRGRAIGAWSGLGSIAAAIGPLVGGAPVEDADWRGGFPVHTPPPRGAGGGAPA